MNEHDNLWLLQNRIARIFNVITQYGESNFAISFSGGVDSTVLAALVDMAMPNNSIPRVYADTGIEYKMVRDFVLNKQKSDSRIVIIKPTVPIKKMLEQEGYPFKSKMHSKYWDIYSRDPQAKSVYKYVNRVYNFSSNNCPKCLEYQFTGEYKGVKISDKCCKMLKEIPLKKWQKEHNKPYAIIGLMREEEGRRSGAKCLAFDKKRLKAFQPLVNVTKEWERWFIEKYNIEICDIYKPPYNFRRTGCKGCPFSINLQKELEILENFFPNERKQCEAIWKPVYEEYRRIGYRLKSKNDYEQLSMFND